MKKRTITVLVVFALLFTLSPVTVCADSASADSAGAASDPLLSKATYYTEETDYIPGDCILTATRMMIRRSAIMHGRTGWGSITNEVLRPAATTLDGCLMYRFSYEAEGITYDIRTGSFSGESDAERIGEFERLLKKHPEGIVVWGVEAASTGTHGVLVTDVRDGEVYVMDASYNMGIFSEGIQKWTDSTMLAPSLVTDYWYINDLSPDEDAIRETQQGDFHFKTLRVRITSV